MIQLRLQRKDGSWCDVEAVVSNQLDRPSIAGYVANVRDITERKRFEALLAHRALHDPLTGLANRQLILDRADQMLARARRTGDRVAAYFIDLDNFKDANDSLGHEAGDQLLQAVAGRLLGLLRASDTRGTPGRRRVRHPGRRHVPGGRTGTGGRTDPRGPAGAVPRRGVRGGPDHRHRQRRHRGGRSNCSAGPAAATRTSLSTGPRPKVGTGLVLFEPAMQSAAQRSARAQDRLGRRRSQNGEFFLLYQPIFDLENFRIRGMEALLRWKHPTKGTILPGTFIPVLEDSRKIVDVGRWVLAQACRQAAIWHAQGFETTVSVNVSMRQLEADAADRGRP